MLVVYRVSDARWTAPRAPNEVLGPLVGRRVEELRRRGKYLIAAFEDELFLLMHLRMTGNLLYDAEPGAPYTRAIISGRGSCGYMARGRLPNANRRSPPGVSRSCASPHPPSLAVAAKARRPAAAAKSIGSPAARRL